MASPVRRSLAGGAFASLAGQVALVAANGLLSIAVARIVGPSGTGVYGLALTVFSILAPASTIGLKAGIGYLVSRGEWPARRALAESQLAALGLSGVATALAFAVYLGFPEGPLQDLSDALLGLTMATVGLAVAWVFSSGILLAIERYEAFALSQMLQAAVTLSLGVAFTLAFEVVGALVALALAQLTAAVVTAVAVLRASPGKAVRALRLSELRRGARFGSKTWLSEMMWGLNFRIDVVVLSAYVATSTVGAYFVAGSLGALAWVLPGALQNVVMPRAAALQAGVERGEVRAEDSDATVARSLRHAVLLCLPIGAGLAVLFWLGVPLLFGPGFSDATLYGFLLLPGLLAGCVGKVAGAALVGRGRPGYTLAPMLVVTPIAIVLYLIVIPSDGAVGAAIVSSASYAASALMSLALLRRTTGLGARAMLVPRRGDVSDYSNMLFSLRRYVTDRLPA